MIIFFIIILFLYSNNSSGSLHGNLPFVTFEISGSIEQYSPSTIKFSDTYSDTMQTLASPSQYEGNKIFRHKYAMPDISIDVYKNYGISTSFAIGLLYKNFILHEVEVGYSKSSNAIGNKWYYNNHDTPDLLKNINLNNERIISYETSYILQKINFLIHHKDYFISMGLGIGKGLIHGTFKNNTIKGNMHELTTITTQTNNNQYIQQYAYEYKPSAKYKPLGYLLQREDYLTQIDHNEIITFSVGIGKHINHSKSIIIKCNFYDNINKIFLASPFNRKNYLETIQSKYSITVSFQYILDIKKYITG